MAFVVLQLPAHSSLLFQNRKICRKEKDFQERVRRIGALVEEIEGIADPAVRTSTRQLVQLVMEFHGTALDRALEILANGGEPGMAFIEQLGRDPMVGSLLVLYGLHPESLETRVAKRWNGLSPNCGAMARR